MKRAVPWEPWAAIGALAVLVAVGAWWLILEIDPVRRIVPGCKEPSVVSLSAELPPLRAYEEFYTNEENPFVPYAERGPERITRVKKPDIVPPRKPAPPPKIEPIQPPQLKLPPKSVGGGDAPKVLGIFGKAGERPSAIVQISGDQTHHVMSVGDTVAGWTLIEINGVTVTKFKDRNGREFTLLRGGGR